MPSKTARRQASGSSRTIVFFVYPGVKLLDLAGPLQAFTDAVDERSRKPAYRTVVVSVDGGETGTDAGLPIVSESAARWRRRRMSTLVVVGGDTAREASRDERIVRCVVGLAGRSERVASVCTGAYLLAAGKLLNGRRAVTHWQSCDALAADYPSVRIEKDRIYIRDGNVWTSAGVTAGIDLAIGMIGEDLGRRSALAVARSLVTYLVRPGGQSQFSVALDRQALDRSDRFDELHRWMLDNLDRDLRVASLAAKSNMSSRNFSRLYAARTGSTPAKAVEAMRAETARQLLEESGHSVARIAELTGFGDDERMRRVFVRKFGVPPLDYRQRFQRRET